ncbi:MAG: histidine kinase dimerization/phospho-acceptor domain-containing protein [Gemmatimonadota bacterium]
MSSQPEEMELLRALAPRSVMAVPLKARDRVMGALAFFCNQQSGREHDDIDLELAEELSRRAALALENARLCEQANAALQAHDDVLAVVSHDLGNPLSAIRFATAVLSRQLPVATASEGAFKQIENIRSSVLQMERLIRDLLQVKQIEAGF